MARVDIGCHRFLNNKQSQATTRPSDSIALTTSDFNKSNSIRTNMHVGWYISFFEGINNDMAPEIIKETLRIESAVCHRHGQFFSFVFEYFALVFGLFSESAM